ncbi:MAG: hypothetical protein QOI12_836 [Alphaproteobacteria bacterium]|jgi:energy-coupling factor transporter transmembrane protein EcfT|nr:hypothetical protein [Alphaproteobacteria bacterium]
MPRRRAAKPLLRALVNRGLDGPRDAARADAVNARGFRPAMPSTFVMQLKIAPPDAVMVMKARGP